MGDCKQMNVIHMNKAKETNIVQENIITEVSQNLYDYLINLPIEREKNQSDISAFIYDTCPVELIGRQREMNLLNDFVSDSRKVLWWAITGLPGSGKTRLAYEFMRKLNNHNEWIARFLSWPIFFKDFKNSDFSVNDAINNILLVIDYMYAYEEQIASWIEWMVAHSSFNYKLRILIIEREYTRSSKSNPWEELFLNGFYKPDNFHRLKYRESNLNLNGYLLGKDSSREIIKSYCGAKSKSISESEINQILTLSIKANNNKTSPLLLMIFSEYYLEEHQKGFNINLYDVVLSKMILREKNVIYKTINAKGIIDKEIINDIMIASTILGGINVKKDLGFLEKTFDINKEDLCKWIEKFSCTSLFFLNYENEGIINGIQPDLIGEYFIYDYFKNLSVQKTKKLLDSFNANYSKRLLSFLLRFIADHSQRLQECEKLVLFNSYIPDDRRMMFKAVDDEGFTIECEVLFTFESDETGKNYIVYTDNTFDEEGNTKVYASIYNPNTDQTKLLPIETEKEWKVIETLLSELQQEVDNAETGLDNLDDLSEIIEKKFNDTSITL